MQGIAQFHHQIANAHLPQADPLQGGLAAASVPKPTVAQYTQCFRYLQIAKLAKESGLYGEAPRHEVMVMLDNFPEKCVSMENI